MGHYDKLYQRIKQNPKNVMFGDLETLMIKIGGFTSKPRKGDHYSFTHPDLKRVIILDSKGKRKPLDIAAVKDALCAFDEMNPKFGMED